MVVAEIFFYNTCPHTYTHVHIYWLYRILDYISSSFFFRGSIVLFHLKMNERICLFDFCTFSLQNLKNSNSVCVCVYLSFQFDDDEKKRQSGWTNIFYGILKWFQFFFAEQFHNNKRLTDYAMMIKKMCQDLYCIINNC